MELLPEFQPPRAPRIEEANAPGADAERLKYINDRLREIERFNANFAAAVSLSTDGVDAFQNKNGSSLISAWKFVAARDACMSLYHFCKAIENFEIGGKGPIYDAIDFQHIRNARRLFREKWPEIERLRVALAHAGEVGDTLEKSNSLRAVAKYEANGVVVEAGGGRIGEGWIEGVFLTTFDGKMIQADITHDAIKTLNSIAAIFYSAFQKN